MSNPERYRALDEYRRFLARIPDRFNGEDVDAFLSTIQRGRNTLTETHLARELGLR